MHVKVGKFECIIYEDQSVPKYTNKKNESFNDLIQEILFPDSYGSNSDVGSKVFFEKYQFCEKSTARIWEVMWSNINKMALFKKINEVGHFEIGIFYMYSASSLSTALIFRPRSYRNKKF